MMIRSLRVSILLLFSYLVITFPHSCSRSLSAPAPLPKRGKVVALRCTLFYTGTAYRASFCAGGKYQCIRRDNYNDRWWGTWRARDGRIYVDETNGVRQLQWSVSIYPSTESIRLEVP